jgi:hypothetical protein
VSSRHDGFATPDSLRRLALLAIPAIALTACGSSTPAAHSATSGHGTTTTRVHAKKASHAPTSTTSTEAAVATTTTVGSTHPSTTIASVTTTTASSGPTADQTQIAQGGCSSLGDLSDAIGEAGDAGNAQPLQSFQSSNDYPLIVNLNLLSSVAAYQKLGTDAGPFANVFASAVQSDSLTALQSLYNTLATDCQALGMAIGND